MFVGIARKHCDIMHILLTYKVHQELKDLLVKIVLDENVCRFNGNFWSTRVKDQLIY